MPCLLPKSRFWVVFVFFAVWHMSAQLGITLISKVVKKVVKSKKYSILLPENFKLFLSTLSQVPFVITAIPYVAIHPTRFQDPNGYRCSL